MSLIDEAYFKLYANEILTDQQLMECSAEAHGVYLRLICILHLQDNYGKLKLPEKYLKRCKKNNKIDYFFASFLSKKMPFNVKKIHKSLRELVAENIIKIEENYLINERMKNDANLSILRSKCGSKGGKQKQKNMHKNNEFCYSKMPGKMPENNNEFCYSKTSSKTPSKTSSKTSSKTPGKIPENNDFCCSKTQKTQKMPEKSPSYGYINYINNPGSYYDVLIKKNKKNKKNNIIQKKTKKTKKSIAHLEMSESQYDAILQRGYTDNQIQSIFADIENYPKIDKYTDLSRLTLNWLKRKYGKKSPSKYDDATITNAKKIYLEYPKKGGGSIAVNAICEALQKISFDKLIFYVRLFSQKQKQLSTDERYITSPAKWFENEMWIDIQTEKEKKEKDF